MFFTLFGYWVWGAGVGGSPKGLVHNLLMQLSTLGSSKLKFSAKAYFFDMVTTKNDHPIYAKHDACINVSFNLFGDGVWRRCGVGQSPRGLVHHVLMHVLTMGTSKIEVSDKAHFRGIVTAQNDNPICVKHALGRIDVFYPHGKRTAVGHVTVTNTLQSPQRHH